MDEFILAVKTIFGGAWSAMTQLKYPLVGISFAVILIGAFIVVFSLRLMSNVFGWSISAGSVITGYGQVGGNNKKITISGFRYNDTK